MVLHLDFSFYKLFGESRGYVNYLRLDILLRLFLFKLRIGSCLTYNRIRLGVSIVKKLFLTALTKLRCLLDYFVGGLVGYA